LDNDYDPDGDLLEIVGYQIITTGLGGSFSCDAERCFYDSDPGWDGSGFVFNYTIDDGKGGTARGTATVTGF
jgi:hypothetical protein